ncbi:MAG TPA: zinc-dependent metalloprotease, partial [Bdellovibrionales bacterium]|nr:zinc-dependent metalloprotease [Bdellovibrionales bacterium]
MNAPLGIGFATADVMNGEFKFGSVNVWSGIMEEYINKYAAAEMAYGRMLEGSGSHINRETLFDAEALESSLRPYMEAGGIEGFVRSPEGMKTLKDHLAIMEESNGWLYQAAVDSQPQITPEMKAQVQALRHNQLSYADYSSYIDQDLLNVARTNPTFDMLSVFHNHFSSEIFDAPESLTKEAVASQMSRDQRLTLAAQVAKKEITAIAQASAQDGDRLAAHVVPELILALRDAKAGDPNIDETRILHTALKSLLSHELGHVLGLGHNFKGNQMPIKGTVADDDYHAAQEQYATKGYVRSTVMDYTSPKAEVKMAYEDMIPGPYDIQVLRYLYNGEYPVIAADGKTKRYIKIAANGVVPDKTEDPQTGEALTAGFLPACNDIEASLNFNPYCQRHDRGHNAVEMVTTRFKDLNASLSAQLNAFSNAKGGNAGLKKYYLWSRLLREFGQVRVFYDYMRVLLDEQPEYRDAFARIRRSQDALIAFSEACIDPNKAPAGFERAFAQLALRDPSKLGTPVTALKEEDFTEVRDLCAANAIALNQWGDLMRRKGSDYTTYDRQFRYTTSGIFGGEYDGDWSYLWGAYQELGAFPVRLTTLMTVTNPFPYFLWGGIIPNPIYANNQGMYSYAPLYPKEFGMVIDTTVRENLNLGGGPNNENTEIGSTLMYTYYFMARNRIYTKDNDNRFPAIYLENLNGLTSFEIKVSPIIMTNVNKEGAPDSQVFGYQASYLDMAKYEAVSIPYAYLLTDRRVIAQGNAKQVFLPFTKFRYLTDKWGYVWALDLRYHHKEDDPLKGFSVKNGLNLMAQKQIETCAQGATGLSSFFNMTNQDFKGF